jgi:hypothetical protein
VTPQGKAPLNSKIGVIPKRKVVISGGSISGILAKRNFKRIKTKALTNIIF